MKAIALGGVHGRGRVALLDDEDYGLVAPYTWYAWMCPTRKQRYAATARRVDGRHRTLFMHTLITGYALTDHINRDTLDNRRVNLRPATIAQNAFNSPPRQGSSRYKGVTWHAARGKWAAAIKVGRRSRYLGIFASEEDAALAYNAAALEAAGEYAYLNQMGK